MVTTIIFLDMYLTVSVMIWILTLIIGFGILYLFEGNWQLLENNAVKGVFNGKSWFEAGWKCIVITFVYSFTWAVSIPATVVFLTLKCFGLLK